MKVVNLYKEKYDVYGGRSSAGDVPEYPNKGWLGNPFDLREHGREKCIALFKDLFLKKVDCDEEFRNAVLSLKGKTVGCFCKPKDCHLDVVAEWINKQ